jgi:hypothetical protein
MGLLGSVEPGSPGSKLDLFSTTSFIAFLKSTAVWFAADSHVGAPNIDTKAKAMTKKMITVITMSIAKSIIFSHYGIVVLKVLFKGQLQNLFVWLMSGFPVLSTRPTSLTRLDKSLLLHWIPGKEFGQPLAINAWQHLLSSCCKFT